MGPVVHSEVPVRLSLVRRVELGVATGFGLGHAPWASGTVATFLGIGLAALLAPLPTLPYLLACLGLVGLAVPICTHAEQFLGQKDDRRIVADEYLTFPLTLAGLPWVAHPWVLMLAFVMHRALDVLKPPPARCAQQWPGGWGIVADDFFAALYALALNHLLFGLITGYGPR